MSLAVVRCPTCRGASRVSADALGHMVGCPRCQVPFVAEEEIPVVHPVARTVRAAVPVAPPRRPSVAPEEPPPTSAPGEAVPEIPDPEHDPHLPPVAGLPVSVLVGLALVPFGIPLVWRVAPLVTGQDAALSLAVPVALAVAAAALCLGVVFTIDWTAATRIKGVLMLVGLAYLSAAGLFFLKKDTMDRVRAWDDEPNRWTRVPVQTKDYDFEFRLPPQPARVVADVKPVPKPPLPRVTMDDARHATYAPEFQGEYRYLVAWGKPDDAAVTPTDVWFGRVRAQLDTEGATVAGGESLEHGGQADVGRQWTLAFADGTVRIVRVYVVKSRVYYLSAAGPKLTPDDADFAKPFFDSFLVNIK